MTEASSHAAGDRFPRSEPLVSVVVANRNGGRFIDDALASCARQSLRAIEIIVVDDASTDDSISRVRDWIRRDDRVRLLVAARPSGPGGARNLGFDAARGRWIAVLDSDDIMHPRRLETLLAAAERDALDIVADNQLVFDHARIMRSRPLLPPHRVPSGPITAEHYADCNRLFTGAMPLGYLKPLLDRSFLLAAAVRYDPTLPIAEDYDLVLRLLLAGARYGVHPELLYFYRRHSGSISHRLTPGALLPMLAADDRLRASFPPSVLPAAVLSALDRRRNTIRRALRFDALVHDLKERRWRDALSAACRDPGTAALLRIPLRDRLRRATRRPPASPASPTADDRPRVTVLSRQRVVGRTNGSSAYLLGLCDALRHAGYQLDLLSPSPAMFGRLPFLRLDPAMDVFAAIRIRGAVRVGRAVIARDPRIALRAVAGVLDRALRRIGLHGSALGRPAPHAIAVPLRDADRRFLADAARPSRLILADYAFLNEAIPFVLQPGTASAVVMHDLFSSQDPERRLLHLDRRSELALLEQADAVLAIQNDEAAAIRDALPHRTVILSPMAIEPVAAPQPGANDTLLFVGSNTLPNLDGIGWFLAEVWPALRRHAPQACLLIAGTCCGGLGNAGAGVTLLGRVDDLASVYRDCGVVVSPLRLGSGLKIKLVEALGHGKATIATATTLQGVDELVGDAVVRADTAAAFVAAILPLLRDPASRERLADAALRVARQHFAAEACYAGLLRFADAAAAAPIPGSDPRRRTRIPGAILAPAEPT